VTGLPSLQGQTRTPWLRDPPTFLSNEYRQLSAGKKQPEPLIFIYFIVVRSLHQSAPM
jgi:hypothetical protein